MDWVVDEAAVLWGNGGGREVYLLWVKKRGCVLKVTRGNKKAGFLLSLKEVGLARNLGKFRQKCELSFGGF